MLYNTLRNMYVAPYGGPKSERTAVFQVNTQLRAPNLPHNSLHAGGHVCGPCACIQELPVTREATYVALAIAGQRLLALYSVS